MSITRFRRSKVAKCGVGWLNLPKGAGTLVAVGVGRAGADGAVVGASHSLLGGIDAACQHADAAARAVLQAVGRHEDVVVIVRAAEGLDALVNHVQGGAADVHAGLDDVERERERDVS